MRLARHEALIDILRRAHGPVSGPVLARELGVSSRTVRSDVTSVNALAGAPVIVAEHRGYTLDGSIQVPTLAPDDTATGSDARIFAILRRLARSPQGESVHELASSLFVSESTIEADLTKVRPLVREFDVTLTRNRDMVSLAGREVDRRRLVRQMLLGSARGAASSSLGIVMRELRRFDLGDLGKILQTSLGAGGIVLHDYALADLTLHLAIALDRFADGQTSEVEVGDVKPSAQILDTVAELAARLQESLGIVLPSSERIAFAALLESRTYPGAKGPDGAVDEHVALVRTVISDLSSQYLLDINDEVFVLNLSIHVKNLLARARTGHEARNPLGPDFKEGHPLVHELAVFVASRIEELANVTVGEEEIVYLALHIGGYLQRTLEDADQVSVACIIPEYYGSQGRFLDRLRVDLGDTAASVEAVPLSRLDAPASIGADLIVSAVQQLEIHGDVSIVEVSPLLSRSDLDRVNAAVRATRDRKSAARIRWTLSELLDPRLFLRVKSTTRDEALRMMSEQLISQRIAPGHFLEDVRSRERLSSTAFHGSIAVPHSMNMDCFRTAISVLISDEPIVWGESNVRMVALFALSPTGRQVFRDVLDAFVAVLAEPSRIQRIVGSADNYEHFVAAVLAETE